MFIQTLLPPVAGQVFRFSVAGCSGTTNIDVHANDQRLLKRDFTGLICKSEVIIPDDFYGATLSISAVDSSGKHQSIEYVISASDPGPHSMLAASR